MSTIVVKATLQQTDSVEAVLLSIYTDSRTTAGFDQIEVWRSKVAINGPWEEITAYEDLPAKVPYDALEEPETPIEGALAMLSGNALEFTINGVTKTHTFTGTNPIHLGEGATQLNDAFGDIIRAYVTTTGVFVIRTLMVGLSASVQITGGDAAPILVLPTEGSDSLVYGKAARINLIVGQNHYTFTDPLGSAAYYYKVSFRNRSDNTVGPYSIPFSVWATIVTDPTELCVGYLDLVQIDGKPLINQQVRLNNEFSGVQIGTRVMAGADIIGTTDSSGHVEFTLIRGQRVTVLVAGTSLVRAITIPTDVDRFDLMDPNIADEDVFKVATPTIIAASRRSML